MIAVLTSDSTAPVSMLTLRDQFMLELIMRKPGVWSKVGGMDTRKNKPAEVERHDQRE